MLRTAPPVSKPNRFVKAVIAGSLASLPFVIKKKFVIASAFALITGSAVCLAESTLNIDEDIIGMMKSNALSLGLSIGCMLGFSKFVLKHNLTPSILSEVTGVTFVSIASASAIMAVIKNNKELPLK